MVARDERMEVPRHRGSHGLWSRWVLATAGGELVGFAVPATVGALSTSVMGEPASILAGLTMLGLMVLAGMAEGGVLGLAQGLVLRRYVQGLAQRQWVVATALAAGLAWAIGMLPSTLVDTATVDPMVMVGSMALLGVVFVASIGAAQWLVLRRYIQKAGWWILANAIAWPLGVAVPFGGMALVPDGSPVAVWVAVWVAVGVASGVLMGVVVGAITGIALVWLLRTDLSCS